MEYKLALNCSNCKKKLQISVSEGMFDKKKVVSCNNCNEFTTIMVPSEIVFENKNKNNKQAAAEATFISDNFQKETTFRLLVLTGEFTNEQVFDLKDEKLTIGRKNNGGPEAKPDIEIRSKDGYMSKKHAELIRTQDNLYVIKDLNSANGTWVNGEKLSNTDKLFLENGDEIKMGRTYFKINID
jgi:pSer/pThr/pTyr-binding forkhead associated (FHA) protein